MLKDIKYKGINTESNGYDATAGQLAVAHNVVNDHGYLETLNPPAQAIEYWGHSLTGYKCLFRHEMLSGVVNYIFYRRSGDFTDDFTSDFVCNEQASLVFLSATASPGTAATEVTWLPGSAVQTSITTEGNLYQVTAVGNTLCVLTAVGMDYFVWKNGTYQELGTALPEVNIRFGLELEATAKFIEQWTNSQSTVTSDSNDSLNNGIHAAVNEFNDTCKKDGKFVYSFLVRYALKLFDGTLVHHSSPVLMCVNDWCAPTAHIRVQYSSVNHDYMHQLWVYLMSGRLLMNIQNAIPTSWRDIVIGVEIYASAPFQKFPDDQKPIEWNGSITYTEDDPPVWADGFGGSGYGRTGTTGADANFNKRGMKEFFIDTYAKKHYGGNWDYNYQVIYRNQQVDISHCGVFYKIFEYDAAFTDTAANYQNWIEVDTGDLTNLVTNTLMEDDYDSHDIKTPKEAYVYNQRINIYDLTSIVKMPFEAETYQQYLSPSGTDSYTYRLAVKVVRDDGEEVWLPTSYTTNFNQMAANILYLYIPIPNVLEARFYKWLTISSNIFYSWYPLTMQKHPTLNGCVWFGDFSSPALITDPTSPIPEEVSQITRSYFNKIYTSEVGNPFNFPVGGINTVGIGKILALASNVRAISQGQFGEYPLYVFTDSGIWMLEVDDKGLYKAKQPMSLDKVLPNTKVTSMDNAVAYVTERGLMLVSGSETRCISEVLDGKFIAMPDILGGFAPSVNWETFKTGISCAYDSDNRRLHVYNPEYLWHYVFSVRTGEWTTMSDTYFLRDTISGHYVDTEMCLIDFNEEATAAAMTQTIMTRAISFETDAYKRMRDNMLRGDIDALRAAGKLVSVLLQGSNDLQTWINIGAVSGHYRMVRKTGTPYKWFRWKIVINSLPRDYKLHGITADVEVTGNNKLR